MFARYALATLAVLLLAAPAWAATPIGATVIHVEGKAEVVSRDAGVGNALRLNDTVAAGDTIVTGADGVVEIRFDNNDQIRIDRKTRLTVQSLHREESGATFSVFGLLFGRVKSAVNKLLTKDSRFEYQTKAAVAGVAGTPPWVVAYDPDTEEAEIDLLGEPNEEGAVFVRGFDARRTLVTVLSGQRTTVRPGQTPRRPFPIDPARFRKLRADTRFNVEPKPKEEPAPRTEPTPEPEAKEEEPKKVSPMADILKTQAAHTVSTPAKLAPTSEKNASDFNAGTNSQQGTVGEIGGEQETTPPVANYRIEVDFR